MANIRGNNNLIYGLSSPLLTLPAPSILSKTAPTSSQTAELGTVWIYVQPNLPPQIYIFTTDGWIQLALDGGSGFFDSLTVNGPANFNGELNSFVVDGPAEFNQIVKLYGGGVDCTADIIMSNASFTMNGIIGGGQTFNITCDTSHFLVGSSLALESYANLSLTSYLDLILNSDQGLILTAARITYPSLNVTTSPLSLQIGVINVINVASLAVATLPASANVGTIIKITGNSASGWKIAQNAGQIINSTAASTTIGVTGSLSSGGRYDCVELVCTVANTTWSIVNSTGTLVFV